MGGLEALAEAGIEVGTDIKDGRITVVGTVPGTQQPMVQGKLAMVIDCGTEVKVAGKVMEVETVIEEEVEVP